LAQNQESERQDTTRCFSEKMTISPTNPVLVFDDEAGQVVDLAAQAVGDPRAHAGAAGEFGAVRQPWRRGENEIFAQKRCSDPVRILAGRMRMKAR
jgi:hypothetical protein